VTRLAAAPDAFQINEFGAPSWLVH